MIYKVKATLLDQKAPLFYEKLTNGSILNQEPDGREIVAAMKRACLVGPGVLAWYEKCFCASPLHHERTTVYDHFLEKIETEEVEEMGTVEGDSFWDHLETLAKA